MNKLLLLGFLLPLQLIPSESFAQHKGITFQGILKRPDGTLVNVPGTTANVKVLTPNGCVLRDEDFGSVNITSGYINLVVGKGATNGSDPGKTIQAIMNNTTAITGLNCLDSNNNVLSAGQTYTPTSIDARKLRLSLTLDGSPVIMDFNMRALPFAVNSETLNGKLDTAFVNINTPQGVTQTNLESVFARFTKLDSILNNFDGTGAVLTGNATNVTGTVAIANGGTGATTAAAARTNLGLGPLATMAPTGTADNTTYLRGDGTWAAASGGAVTSVAGRTGVVTLTSADLTDFNAASDTRADGRITAQKGVASGLASLDGSGKVPSTQLALVAGDIPNLDAAKITSGTITQNVSATSVAGTTGSFTTLRIYDGTANFLSQTAPAGGFTANYTAQWPAAIGTSGQALQISSVAGAVATLGWVTPTAAPVTSVAGKTGVVTLAAADIASGTLTPAQGGTGQSTYTDGQLLIGNTTGNTLSKATLTAGTGVTITNGNGTISIAATGSGGTVTAVTSANADIAVATGTTTPALTLNSGTGANQIVKLDASAKYPAVDGSLITNIAAANFTGVLPVANGGTNSSTALNNSRLMTSVGGAIVEAAAMTDGQIVVGKTGSAPQLVAMSGDATVSNVGAVTLATVTVAKGGTATTSYGNNKVIVSNGTGSALVGTNCALNQVISFDAGGSLTCANVSDLSSAFQNGGNSFGANATLGTNDNYTLGFETNNSVAMTILANGNVGVGTATPNASAILELASTTKGVLIPRMTAAQRDAITPVLGLQVYNTDTNQLNYHNGTAWTILTSGGGGSSQWTTAGSDIHYTAGKVGIGTSTMSGELSVQTLSAAAIGASIRATASQSADMLQIQDSSGVAQFAINLGSATFSGSNDTNLGVNAGKSLTTGTYNTFVGNNTGNLVTTGSFNTAMGAQALQTATVKGANTAVGHGALRDSTGGDNTAVGAGAMKLSTSGEYNVAIGSNALTSNSSGSNNVAVGDWALKVNTTGANNAVLGQFAGSSNLTGGQNVYLGQGAGSTSTGSGNVFIGNQAGANELGSNKLYIANTNTATPLISGDFSTGFIGVGVVPNTALDVNGALSVRNMAAPAVSVAGQGRIYFDTTSNTFKVSQNNGAYVDLVGAGGTVTSVGLALPAEITVSNSPVTTTGSLTGAWANQTTNKVFAAPNGSTGTPTFRALVNADLPVIDIAHGGTGLAAGTSGGIPYFDATTTMASSAALTANGVILGGGAGASPTATAAGAAYQPLRVPAGGGAPAFGAIDLSQAAAVTGTLAVANGGTGVTSFSNYSVVASNGSGAIISVPGTTAGSILQYSATGPVWTTATFPVSTTANQLLYSSANNVVGGLATANSSILKTDGSGVPSWGAISSDVFTQYALLAGRASGQSLSGGIAASENLTLDSTAHATKGYVLLNASGGKVGIGNSAPRGTLDVSGTVLSKAATLNGTTTIDFSSGNLQYTASNCGAFILHNLKDGGAYMFAVQGTSITTCSFTAFSDAGSTALTVHLPPDHADTTSGKHTVYNLAVLGGHVYVAWTPGY